ncbi:hypothetical protein D9M68_944870 [compost metagenome]
MRLNGAIHDIFKDWLQKNFPDRFGKVWHQIEACHNGTVNDSRFGNRMQGDGNFAEMLKRTFSLHCRRNQLNNEIVTLNRDLFQVPGTQLRLF